MIVTNESGFAANSNHWKVCAMSMVLSATAGLFWRGVLSNLVERMPSPIVALPTRPGGSSCNHAANFVSALMPPRPSEALSLPNPRRPPHKLSDTPIAVHLLPHDPSSLPRGEFPCAAVHEAEATSTPTADETLRRSSLLARPGRHWSCGRLRDVSGPPCKSCTV